MIIFRESFIVSRPCFYLEQSCDLRILLLLLFCSSSDVVGVGADDVGDVVDEADVVVEPDTLGGCVLPAQQAAVFA